MLQSVYLTSSRMRLGNYLALCHRFLSCPGSPDPTQCQMSVCLASFASLSSLHSQFCAGDELIDEVPFLQYSNVALYEYDTSCATITQTYSMALNYGKIFQPLAIRPLNTSVCFTANCLLGTFAFSAYAGGCYAGSEHTTLSSGSFEVDTCIVAPLILGDVSHTASFKINCAQHVEEEQFDGYLPVITARALPVLRKLAFELVLGGVTAADLTESVVLTLKQSVSGHLSIV